MQPEATTSNTEGIRIGHGWVKEPNMLCNNPFTTMYGNINLPYTLHCFLDG